MIAIERLVCSATRADERTLLPAGGEERIVDRLDKLVERMARMEKRRMEAREEQRGGDDGWDPETSLLANKENIECGKKRALCSCFWGVISFGSGNSRPACRFLTTIMRHTAQYRFFSSVSRCIY